MAVYKARKARALAAREKHIAAKRISTEKHLGMPWAEWRLKKRQQWMAVTRAIDLFGYGAAYTPAGNDLYELTKAMARISEAMAEDWVAW